MAQGIPARCVYALPTDLDPLDRLPSNRGRSSAVHNLVKAFGLIRTAAQDSDDPVVNRARVVLTDLASRAELEEFHDPEYIGSLLRGYDPQDNALGNKRGHTGSGRAFGSATSELDRPATEDTRSAEDGNLEEFGLEHDCPPFPKMAQYVLAVAGAALQTSRELREDRADIGIVWDGGRHHAQRSTAAGFCYINDAALAISELRRQPVERGLKKLDRVLYLDMLDIHHGDGVELAFWNTSRVLTLSAHFHDPKGGFYPLSGDVLSSGPAPPSPAASHALNIPIRIPGALSYVCRRTIIPLISAYQPSAVVIQCGVDGLAGDPIGGRLWGLGLKEMGSCLETVIQNSICHDRKVLLLGGGGYHTPNVARAWAYFTSIALGRKFDLEETEIPLEVQGDVDYAPTYSLDVPGLERPLSEHKKGRDISFENDTELQAARSHKPNSTFINHRSPLPPSSVEISDLPSTELDQTAVLEILSKAIALFPPVRPHSEELSALTSI
ncbi:hypothetical protein PCANC_11715 [Puccinia coronata f. sp. avenae]|uniref:histone deacetylase n=1 Tax=Puccinia coronata f. sp. avenae TaxID=200324 RepID=A0A2N5STB9_9BASI|nr:hypothetical protein PCANC_11715 [Puccinia coronata f. sp. avenae]